jgi:hypothetical protein
VSLPLSSSKPQPSCDNEAERNPPKLDKGLVVGSCALSQSPEIGDAVPVTEDRQGPQYIGGSLARLNPPRDSARGIRSPEKNQ